MYCFWAGEVGLAGLPGVISTRPVFAGGREAVEVIWDARSTSFERLLRSARDSGVASGYVATREEERDAASRWFDRVFAAQPFPLFVIIALGLAILAGLAGVIGWLAKSLFGFLFAAAAASLFPVSSVVFFSVFLIVFLGGVFVVLNKF